MASAPPIQSLWHPGEKTLQDHIGVAERMELAGKKVVRSYMPDQHREFYQQLPFMVVGTVDGDGAPWATIVAGHPGFITSPDDRRLSFKVERDSDDPAHRGLGDQDAIGLLGIELHTRRRNRMNGRVQRNGDLSFDVAVDHAFGNCPQYIQIRQWTLLEDHKPGDITAFTGLSDAAREMITAADTFFVASYLDRDDEGRQVDVSHRGGKPGFVRINDDGSLTIPDFAGNLHFNTLGNFLLNPKAGLTFIDFESGDMLQMTGTAEVILESPEIGAFQGAERLWTFKPEHGVMRREATPLRWTLEEFSPNSLMTGDWQQAAERLKAEELKMQWRQFRIAKTMDESSVIRSFWLEPTDGAGLIPHQAGQHLPIRLAIPGEDRAVIRTYTLSVAPSDNAYRISVKREGLASKYLHDQLAQGDIIEARAPAGDFVVDAREGRPAVLMAAGVGVTPMLAMLRHIVYEGLRTRNVRRTVFYYAARSRAERAFDAELADLVKRADGRVRVIRLLEDLSDGAERGVDYEESGRLNMDLLRATLGFDDYDFYMCGPPPFMQAIYDGLRGLNVSDTRIHAEAFGPASLKRTPDAGSQPAVKLLKPSEKPVPVAFSRSAKEARWTPESGTLLDLAEERGLTPEYSCRGGSCGTCRTKILTGAVSYDVEPMADVEDDEALICCAVPADENDGGADRLILDL